MKRVLIIHTGGTLGMVGGEPGPFTPGGDPLKAILTRIPGLSEVADIRIRILAQQDSCNVRGPQWLEWADFIRHETWADGVVIIHGTDTMTHSASILSFLLEERDRPVILTGSQRPLTKVRTDARQNLIDAVTLATDNVPEVIICFDSQGLRGNRTVKYSTTAMGAFVSPNCPPLVRLGVDIQWEPHVLGPGQARRRLTLGDRTRLTWVLPDFPAPEPWRPDGLGVHVIAGLGAGNVPDQRGWAELVRQEQQAGIVHLIVSQCLHGGVQLGMYASSQEVLGPDTIGCADLGVVAAVSKARVGLGQGWNREELMAYLRTPVAGEQDGVGPTPNLGPLSSSSSTGALAGARGSTHHGGAP